MATVTLAEDFSGSRYIIKHISISGVNDTTGSVIIEAAEAVLNDQLHKVKLMEASWNLNDGYDHVRMYWEDEAAETTALYMSGDGSFDASGYGGRYANATADASLVDEDNEILIDILEDGAENDESAGHITVVFKLTPVKAVIGAPT
jgi:hypothetical protein